MSSNQPLSTNLFSIIVVSIMVVALVSWFGSDCVPHPAKGFPPSLKKDFLGRDNLRRISPLTQYSMGPIGNISASLRLSLKTGRILLSLSNFDLVRRGELYSQPDPWVALRRLREFCISVFSKWI